jgi:hypothetical protein
MGVRPKFTSQGREPFGRFGEPGFDELRNELYHTVQKIAPATMVLIVERWAASHQAYISGAAYSRWKVVPNTA